MERLPLEHALLERLWLVTNSVNGLDHGRPCPLREPIPVSPAGVLRERCQRLHHLLDLLLDPSRLVLAALLVRLAATILAAGVCGEVDHCKSGNAGRGGRTGDNGRGGEDGTEGGRAGACEPVESDTQLSRNKEVGVHHALDGAIVGGEELELVPRDRVELEKRHEPLVGDERGKDDWLVEDTLSDEDVEHALRRLVVLANKGNEGRQRVREDCKVGTVALGADVAGGSVPLAEVGRERAGEAKVRWQAVADVGQWGQEEGVGHVGVELVWQVSVGVDLSKDGNVDDDDGDDADGGPVGVILVAVVTLVHQYDEDAERPSQQVLCRCNLLEICGWHTVPVTPKPAAIDDK